MPRRPRRQRWRLGIAVAATVWTVVASPSAAATDRGTVALEGCLLQVIEVHDDRARLQGLVPRPFVVDDFYGPGVGAAAVWTFSCEGASVPGGNAGPAKLSLIGVQIERPDEAPPPVTYLDNFDYYVTGAYTDRIDLVAHVNSTRFPLEHVPDMAFDRTPAPLPTSSIAVPARDGGYRARVAPQLQHPIHDHDNSFWHRSPHGGVSELGLGLFDALDKWCPYNTEGCSRVEGSEGSAMETLLGCPLRTDGLGIDHDPVPRGEWRFARRR